MLAKSFADSCISVCSAQYKSFCLLPSVFHIVPFHISFWLCGKCIVVPHQPNTCMSRLWLSFFNSCFLICMRAAPKVMASTLSYQPTVSEVDIGGGRGWTFPPVSRYTLLPVERWQQRGSLTQWHLPWKHVWSKVWNHISLFGKNGTYWHSLTLAEHLWRPNSGCEHSEAVGGAFQQCDSDMKDKPRSRWPRSAVIPQNEEHLDQLIHANQLAVVTVLKQSVL